MLSWIEAVWPTALVIVLGALVVGFIIEITVDPSTQLGRWACYVLGLPAVALGLVIVAIPQIFFPALIIFCIMCGASARKR